jgi:hypothetical protein
MFVRGKHWCTTLGFFQPMFFFLQLGIGSHYYFLYTPSEHVSGLGFGVANIASGMVRLSLTRGLCELSDVDICLFHIGESQLRIAILRFGVPSLFMRDNYFDQKIFSTLFIE